MNWVVGFVTFFGVAFLCFLAIDWLLDYSWASEGLDPAMRPPMNAAEQWFISTVVGVLAGWVVGKIFGKD